MYSDLRLNFNTEDILYDKLQLTVPPTGKYTLSLCDESPCSLTGEVTKWVGFHPRLVSIANYQMLKKY